MEIIDYLVNRNTGIIKNIVKSNYIMGQIPLISYSAFGNKITNINGKTIVNTGLIGSGFSFKSEKEAKLAAIFENLERYSPMFSPEKTLYSDFKESHKKSFLDPTTITRSFNSKINKVDKIDWVLGTSNLRGQIWIPRQIVYFNWNH